MYELANKYIKEKEYKQLKGTERLFLPDLEISMTIAVPKINTTDMEEISFMSKDIVLFENNVKHTVIVGTHGFDIKFGYWDEDEHKKYIRPEWIYTNSEGNIILIPDYVGYFQEDDSATADVDQPLSLWVNGDLLKGRDPHTLSRFVMRIDHN